MKSRDIRQSEEFASFMQDIGWETEKVSGQNVYLRKFPIVGYFAKCPRPAIPLDVNKFLNLQKNKKIFNLNIAPFSDTKNKNFRKEKNKLLKAGFNIDIEPFNPTTTIRVDLTRTVDTIFKSFSEAKRRAVRRAVKNGITVSTSEDIDAFIKIRQQQFKPLGFLITREMKMLWKNFYPEKADLVLAQSRDGKYVGGILLLYHNRIAYYWFASALKTGKKLFAPTLLVFEAIKIAKKRGSKTLDFEGIYDGRFPKASESWRGFTKFKEGFSDNKIIFMENFYLKRSLFI